VARKIQRNEPCPCGSGKKYKQCCIRKERDRVASSLHRKEAVQHALVWLSQQFQAQIDDWVKDDWLADISEAQAAEISRADPKIRSIHDINLLEQLVAQGRFDNMVGENRPLQLILDSDEVGLDAEQRAYMTQLSEQPLRLYRVVACKPGESFTVQDQFHNGAAVEVLDTYASRMFDVGDSVGLRLLEFNGTWETSGAIYHIPDAYVAELASRLSQAEDQQHSTILIRTWLELVALHV